MRLFQNADKRLSLKGTVVYPIAEALIGPLGNRKQQHTIRMIGFEYWINVKVRMARGVLQRSQYETY